MNGTPLTRYHAEIKLNVEGKEARINVFADTLNEIFSDLAKITIQFDELRNTAKREILNAELKAKQLQKDGVPPPKKDARPAKPEKAGPPVCETCGSNDAMELIKWADKETGEARQAWKCQECKQWHRPNGK
jgi:hypothetical protein